MVNGRLVVRAKSMSGMEMALSEDLGINVKLKEYHTGKIEVCKQITDNDGNDELIPLATYVKLQKDDQRNLYLEYDEEYAYRFDKKDEM